MVSWHRVGQKVAVVDGKTVWFNRGWGVLPKLPLPQEGEICTIGGVRIWPPEGLVAFDLVEYPWWPIGIAARWFRPVYPAVTDLIRSLDAPLPRRSGPCEGGGDGMTPFIDTIAAAMAGDTWAAMDERDRHGVRQAARRVIAADPVRKAVRDYLDGNYARAPKNGQCKHGIWSWETCEQCIDEHFTEALK